MSNGECARRLRCHVSTIGRELKRNRYIGEGDTFYESLHAQQKAVERKEQAWKAKQLEKLKDGWSPEQIAGRWKEEEYPDDPSWYISHETIYQFIYHPAQKDARWWEYLRRGHKKRRKKHGRRVHRSRIPDRVSIHKRPEGADNRTEFGHWEGDSVVGKGRENGLHTTYERLSSLYRLEPMEDLTSRSSIKAQLKIYGSYPKEARKSTTLDNGSEHVQHTTLNKKLHTSTYFADPYSVWQRGGNENANLWLRYYFPKGTDFSKISYEELKAVEWELNNRPRKRLCFETPQEVFDENLNCCNR